MTSPTFAELGLIEPLLRALGAADYSGPTAIQIQAIPPLRPVVWHVTDTTVARVLGPGLVRASALGTTQLVAALPGWRADTVQLVVGSVETVERSVALLDDWSGGIDPAVWHVVGDPQPFTRPAGGVSSRSGVFKNNGDENYASGVVSRAGFSLSGGLTLEVWANLH